MMTRQNHWPRVLRKVVACSCLLASMNCGWAGSQTGQVTIVKARASDDLIWFEMSGSPAAKPACATKSYWMIKDQTSTIGKQQYAMLLAAHASGQTVTVYGANACTRWVDGEDVNELHFQ